MKYYNIETNQNIKTKPVLRASKKINTKSSFTLPFQQSFILCCILKIVKCTKSNCDIDMKQIYNFYYGKCSKLRVECLSFEEISQILSLLESRALITIKSHKRNKNLTFVLFMTIL